MWLVEVLISAGLHGFKEIRQAPAIYSLYKTLYFYYYCYNKNVIFLTLSQWRLYWLRSKVHRHFNSKNMHPNSEDSYIVFTYPRAKPCVVSLWMYPSDAPSSHLASFPRPHITTKCSQSSIPLTHNFVPHTVRPQKFHLSQHIINLVRKMGCHVQTVLTGQGSRKDFLENISTRNARPDIAENIPDTNALPRLQIAI